MKQMYLQNVRRLFEYYKQLGEQTFSQLSEEDLFWEPGQESNSMGIIVNHLAGNMMSRWTDFMTSDGEKEWRNRDREFEHVLKTGPELKARWEQGWGCLFQALDSIHHDDLGREIYIRHRAHTVMEAINRQLTHYSYHVGQIVFLGKMIKGKSWQSLSIPKGQSQQFNSAMFSQSKGRTDSPDDLPADQE